MVERKIRVLLTVPHLTSSASPYREMMALAKYLPKDKYELTICSLRKNGIEETGPLLDALGVQYFIAQYRIKDFRKIPDFIKASRMIEKYGPFDIQHSLDFTSLPLEPVIAKIHGRKFLHQQRNLNKNGHTFYLLLRIFFSDAIIAISPNTQAFLRKIGVKKSKIIMVPLGIDFTSLSSQISSYVSKKHFPSLLMVSNIVPLKRIQDAIMAVSELKDVFPDIELKIVGEDFDVDYRNLLNELVEIRKLAENVIFLGKQSNEDVLREMSNSDLFVHCAEHEAFGWVLLEAFSQHLPVIAAASEGPMDIIRDGENGYLYPVGDVFALKAKIITLLKDRELRKRITDNAFIDAHQKYSAKKMVQEIATVYQEVMNRDKSKQIAL